MGSLLSKVKTPQLDAEGDVDATNSDTENTNLAHEIARWERIYRQRFAREFIVSWGTRSPLWSMVYKPYITPDPWKFGPPSHCRRFQRTTPRYAGPTPEPISAELAAVTRLEQREILFEQFSVLLVRTGDEDHLSAPVDFSAISAAGLDLPLGRGEDTQPGSNDRQQVVRVRIRTAVRFIMDLERRERNASARLTAMKKVLDTENFREADEWASAVLAHAEKNGGIDQDEDAWPAVRLAQAHLNGGLCGLEDPPFETRHPLRAWYYSHAECYKDNWVEL
ncbi:hypothetical protein LA080_012357 [Diaporthe eres]|nr:hypothetical protein LA080_012357 [Diaporthe eres]